MPRVLELTQQVLYLIGCQYVNLSELPRWYGIYRYIAFVGMFSLAVPLITFLMWVESDLETQAQALTMLIGECIVMAKALLVHCNRQQLTVVLSTLQSDLDGGNYFSGKHFEWAERISNRIAIANNASFLLASSAYGLIPIGIICMHLLGGTFSRQVLSWPYDCLLPFDVHTWSGWVAGYAWECVFDFYVITTFMALDGLFIGLCVYGLAYLADLADWWQHLDGVFVRSGGRNAVALKMNLIRAVRRHVHVKGWLDAVAELFTEMLLIQFAAGAFLISDFVYQMQMSDGGNVAVFLMISGSLLGQMFIYCYASTRVTFKVVDTGDQVYCSHWHQYPVQLQPFVAAIVQQMQTPQYMNGMGIVDCSLESFTSLLNFIGTLIAVLQSMK